MRHSLIALLGCISLASVAAGEEVRSLRRPGTIQGVADPVFVEQARLAAWDGGPHYDFGRAVASSGDTLIVGAPSDNSGTGAAYVFVRNGTGWAQQQKLTASDGAVSESFGGSVAVVGDTAVIGAYVAQTPDGRDGAAYVFTRTGTVWTEQQKLVASDGASFHYFGWSLALSADTLVVGALFAPAAYVFVRTGAAWTEQQKLTASDGGRFDRFGSSVALSGDTALVGATNDLFPPHLGAAYVFARSGSTWTEQQKLFASAAAPYDNFGSAVSLSGDTAVIGAWGDTTPADDGSGSAYVFTRSGTAWSEQQRLLPSDGGFFDFFGHSVVIAGNVVVITSHWHDTSAGVDAGSAYVFERSGTVWTEQQELVASDGSSNAEFGHSAALSGGTLFVGGVPGTGYDGAVYVFEIAPTTSDLAVSQSDSPDPVVGLQQVTYTVAVTNLGPEDAVYVSVTDTLPPTATFQSATGSGWACEEFAGVVTCTRVTLAVGPAPPIVVTVTAPPLGGSLTNLASVTHVGPDPVAGNNSASETTTVTAAPTADLSMAKSDGGAPVQWGQPFTWTITVGNAGPNPTTDASVTDAFPAGVTGVVWTCTASVGSSCPAGGTGDIAAAVSLLVGGTATFTATGTVVVGTASLTNTATIAPPAGVYDPSLANNSASVTASAGPYGFYPLVPCRVVDTRTSGPALAANSTRTFGVAGLCQVPADAQAVAAILIAVNPGDLGDLRLYPTGLQAPESSTINFRTGRTRANNVVLPLGAGGQITVQCDMLVGPNGSTHFVLDVVGYFK